MACAAAAPGCPAVVAHDDDAVRLARCDASRRSLRRSFHLVGWGGGNAWKSHAGDHPRGARSEPGAGPGAGQLLRGGGDHASALGDLPNFQALNGGGEG